MESGRTDDGQEKGIVFNYISRQILFIILYCEAVEK